MKGIIGLAMAVFIFSACSDQGDRTYNMPTITDEGAPGTAQPTGPYDTSAARIGDSTTVRAYDTSLNRQ